MFKTWHKHRINQDKDMYCKAKHVCKDIKCTNEIKSSEDRRTHTTKQMAKDGHGQ